MKHNPEALRELQGLLTTLLRVKNEGKTLGMEYFYFSKQDMNEYGYKDCGTVCCVAGWHCLLGKGPESKSTPLVVSEHVCKVVSGQNGGEGIIGHKTWHVLFGSSRGWDFKPLDAERLTPDQTLARQIKAVRWFIHREESRRDYEQLRAMPRKERRALRLAA